VSIVTVVDLSAWGSCLSSKQPLGRATICVDEKRLSGRCSRMHGLD